MKILVHYRHFPVAMGRYIKRGLQRLGHEVFSVGCIDPRGPEFIPWGDFSFPKYVDPPDLVTPDVTAYPLADVLARVPFRPEAVIQAGDVVWLEGKPPVPNVIVMTDPHCVDYGPRMKHADLAICMQDYYRSRYPGSHWVPYAYDEEYHYFMPGQPHLYDAVIIGLQYENRMRVMNELQARGYRVFNRLGLVYHEGTQIYNQGLIAFNWSSLLDLPARFYEGMAYRRLVISNNVPDIDRMGFCDGLHYVGFATADEAVAKCAYYAEHPDLANRIAARGYEAVRPHTWRARAAQIMDLVQRL